MTKQCLSLQVNIDGLPLFKSASIQFWPILGMIEKTRMPFIIGLFCGLQKPKPLDEYLHDFIEEMKVIEAEGIEIEGKHHGLKLSAVICDAPAHSFVKNVKGHSGYSGCTKCTQPGVWNNKMTFLETNAAPRTDKDFRAMTDDGHHLGVSLFQQLNIDLVSQFPLDYMHLVCLGVVRRLILLWMKGPLKTRLGNNMITALSEVLISMKVFIPKEFARKPRALHKVDRWKATEFRQFLLYTGPITLHGKLPQSMYQNFMQLSVGMFLLLSPTLCSHYCDYAHDLLVAVVNNFAKIYGKEMVVYNVHGLTHLAEQVKVYGPLDNISSFAFENFLGRLKKMIRKPNQPLQQAVRRLAEQHQILSKDAEYSESLVRISHCDGPVPHGYRAVTQYKQLNAMCGCVSISEGNNCIEIDNEICLVRNILMHEGRVFLVCERFLERSSLFTFPLNSADIDILKVKRLSGHLDVVQCSSIKRKFVLLSHIDCHVAIPLVHCTVR